MGEGKILKSAASTVAARAARRSLPQKSSRFSPTNCALILITYGVGSFAALIISYSQFGSRFQEHQTRALLTLPLESMEEIERELFPVLEDLRVQHYHDRSPSFPGPSENIE